MKKELSSLSIFIYFMMKAKFIIDATGIKFSVCDVKPTLIWVAATYWKYWHLKLLQVACKGKKLESNIFILWSNMKQVEKAKEWST